MIHYHGTPITPHSERAKMAGKHFCVSFADPRDAEWCLQNGQSIMWDNGGFSAKTRGITVNWTKYFAWLGPRLAHPHWAVIPDVIDGSVDEQRGLVAQWPYGQLGAPVWHMGLPIEYLIELANAWQRVCFGSSGAYWQVGSDGWCRRADEAFNALERLGMRPWVHMLRGLGVAGDRWPFASGDSVTVARNFKDVNADPERMARRMDAVQCPIRWSVRAEQKGLFA